MLFKCDDASMMEKNPGRRACAAVRGGGVDVGMPGTRRPIACRKQNLHNRGMFYDLVECRSAEGVPTLSPLVHSGGPSTTHRTLRAYLHFLPTKSSEASGPRNCPPPYAPAGRDLDARRGHRDAGRGMRALPENDAEEKSHLARVATT